MKIQELSILELYWKKNAMVLYNKQLPTKNYYIFKISCRSENFEFKRRICSTHNRMVTPWWLFCDYFVTILLILPRIIFVITKHFIYLLYENNYPSPPTKTKINKIVNYDHTIYFPNSFNLSRTKWWFP